MAEVRARPARKRRPTVAWLKAAGVTRNDYGLIDGQPMAVLYGMVQKVHEDEVAQAAGAGPCSEHPSQVAGACPYCRGLWATPAECDAAERADPRLKVKRRG